MILTKILLRSYKSFNYDYKKKDSLEPSNFPECKNIWEDEDDFESWRPWVEVLIKDPIACIVGANESGKSHLISSVTKFFSLKPKIPKDICRYSEDMGVGVQGFFRLGFQYTDLSNDINNYLNSLTWNSENSNEENNLDINLEEQQDNNSEENEDIIEESEQDEGNQNIPVENSSVIQEEQTPRIYNSLLILSKNNLNYKLIANYEDEASLDSIELGTNEVEELLSYLPMVVEIKPKIKLLSEINIEELIHSALIDYSNEELDKLLSTNPFKNKPNADEFHKLEINEDAKLVYQLLKYGAQVNYEFLRDLQHQPNAVLKEYSDRATKSIADLLNISHWWAQDVDVQLLIDIRKEKVILMSTDRTSSSYDFDERSEGFQYFLGYILQILLAREINNRPMLILSDEPDFALSAVGQRNLLKFFIEMTDQSNEGTLNQLIYSTHSSELIDPNYPDRITIIRKGLYDEGTYVIKKQLQNLFEPVRSCLGTRISAMPFIDGPNLLVEGPADLIFIVRMSQYLAKMNKKHIDLAEISIIVAEGCNKMPSIVRRALSLSGDRAYLTILLDNDGQGKKTKIKIEEEDPYLKDNNQIVTVDLIHGPGINKDTEIEDLVPSGIYFQCFKKHLIDNGYENYADKLNDKNQFIKEAKTESHVNLIEEIIKSKGIDTNGYVLDKVEIIENVFNLLNFNNIDENDKHELITNIDNATNILNIKIHENLRKKKHEEVRKEIAFCIRYYKRIYSDETVKSKAKELLDNIMSLSAKVSKSSNFDLFINEIEQKYHISDGELTDLVIDHSSFILEVTQAPERLTLEEI